MLTRHNSTRSIIGNIILVITAAMIAEVAAAGSFVKRLDGADGPLNGRTIAMWQSHGLYFDQNEDRWQWQRARLFGTVEDLYTQSYVLPMLVPMLENAGAYVMIPRERDMSVHELVIDRDGSHATGHYSEHNGRHHWTDAPDAGFGYMKPVLEDGDNPFGMGGARMVTSVTDPAQESIAAWSADIPAAGEYAVYISYQSVPESCQKVRYTVNSMQGETHFTVDQRKGGGTWIYLGSFPLKKGRQAHPIVTVTNLSGENGKIITADAVKIGGGMGNVARRSADGEYRTSGKPRFTEAARYWLQWAGVPDSVYSSTEGENDYNDDFRCRGLWVNYLLGGSERLPGQQGLGIPVDMALALHSDAGLLGGDSIVGTMGIYCTERKGKFADGRSRLLSRTLTDSVVTSIVRDIQALHEPQWTRRKMRDRSYAEARMPQVPTVLIELLSHQNPADMTYGLDPRFRFDVSRAIYKGILRYFASRTGRRYTVQPLPVKAFAVNRGNEPGTFILTWQPTPDPLEPTAMPSSYRIEERIGDGAFMPIATSDIPVAVVTVDDNLIHSYRIIAENAGGRSFPSEILAACDLGDNSPWVTVVNGFTRIGAPDRTGDVTTFDGFDFANDAGVPYISDIAYTGAQTEYRRGAAFTSNDAPGLGGSRATCEGTPVAGNSFDNVYTHGRAIAAARHSFISTSAEAFMTDTLTFAPVVDLILGKQKETLPGRGATGPRHKTYPEAMIHRLASLASRGASIMVSGSYIASDLWDNPRATSDDRLFASTILGYQWRASRATASGEVGEIRSKYPQFRRGTYCFATIPHAEYYAVESPDAIAPADSRGAVIMRYTENGLPAATAFNSGNHRTVALGFPFEVINDSQSRDRLMKQILEFLTSTHDK